MKKIITYRTFDMLHYGHIRLLERAKALGDYLIVGITSEDFDKARGKINVRQSLAERMTAVRATGLADEIIVEEYEGQKIDDIHRMDVDVFAVGSDWTGKFDYLNQYCNVVYLERTEGISSSKLRADSRKLRMGIVGDHEIRILKKYYDECAFVNGIEVSGVCAADEQIRKHLNAPDLFFTNIYSELLDVSDAVYILSHPSQHYAQVKEALTRGVHVLCESPIALSGMEYDELAALAREKNAVLMDSQKTAYATAYCRLLLLVKSGHIGDIVSVDATCTSLHELSSKNIHLAWNSLSSWGPAAMLPIFQILGTVYTDVWIVSRMSDIDPEFDMFTKISFLFPHATASMKVGRGIKSEGELVISGTKGYIYVPAPWWKTDYFELRYENPERNRRYFYQLDGEGIRYELVDFVKTVHTKEPSIYISPGVSRAICEIMREFREKKHVKYI